MRVKRLLAMLLCLVMLFSMLPTWALAEGQVPVEEEILFTDEAQEAVEDVYDDPVAGTLFETEEEPEPVEELKEEPVEIEKPVQTEPDSSVVSEPNEPAEHVEPAAAPVFVVFSCNPADAVVTVYNSEKTDETGAPMVINPEEDGSWLLFPGQYLYDVSAEGFTAIERENFEIGEDAQHVQIDVVLMESSEDQPNMDEESKKTDIQDGGDLASDMESEEIAASETELSPDEYSDRFTFTDSDGNQWRCAKNDDGKASIYGVMNARPELYVPEMVTDEEGNAYKVTQVIGTDELNGSTTYWGWGGFTFSGLSSGLELYSISFPDSVTYIGKNAFGTSDKYNGWTSAYQFLKLIVLPQNPDLRIAEMAFNGCINLEYITFRADISALPTFGAIGSYAFGGCTSLKTIRLPSIGHVAADAFYGCYALEEIINCPGELNLGQDLIDNKKTPALSSVAFREGETMISGPYYTWREYIDDTSYYTISSRNLPNLTEIVLPSSALEVSGMDYSNLVSARLNEGLLEIDEGTFANCAKLTQCNLPSTLEEIGIGAFYGCSALTGIESLPNSITYVGDEAFQGCINLHMAVNHPGYSLYSQYKHSGITSLTLSADIREVYPDSLAGCPYLASISIYGAGEYGWKTIDGVLYYVYYPDDYYDGYNLCKYPAAKSNGGVYNIPEFVTYVNACAFDSCNFSEIHIPASVEALRFYREYVDGEYGELHYPFDHMTGPCTICYADRFQKLYDGCGYYVNASGEKVWHTWRAEKPVTKIELDVTSLQLPFYSSRKLECRLTPNDPTDPRIEWSTENSDIVAVDSVGLIWPRGVGLTAITVTSLENGLSASCKVRVPFEDVSDPSAYFYNSVYWAFDNGVTSGTGAKTFSPGNNCTRGQIVTFLWKAMGSPEPSSLNNPFTDVKESDYFYKPVLWAKEKGITSGKTATTFEPGSPCTRGQIVTFLWISKGRPEPSSTSNLFIDVNKTDYFFKAVLWAKEKGITSGTSAISFSPGKTCTRAQAMTFLWNANGRPES